MRTAGVVLNLLLGLDYTVISYAFLAAAQAMTPLFNPGSVKPQTAKVALAGAIGALLFFLGCGAHHLDLALHGFTTGAEEQQRVHMLVMNSAQAIGAPIAIYATWYCSKFFTIAGRKSKS